MRIRRVIFCCMLVAACQSAETPQQADERIAAESITARTELEKVRANFERWYAEGAIDSVATIFTEDHRSLPPNHPASSGRATWLSANRPLLATGKMEIHHVTVSVVANGPLAVEQGRFVATFVPGATAPAGARTSADTGKYLWQWRKVDGRWLIAAASWSSDLPVKQ